MSKRSLFWGNASGKLGEAVLYRAGGEQRARTYVKNVKNPRTRAQMLNRVSMGNLSSFFRANASLLRQSFTNRPSNQSGFNAFVKASKSVASAAIPRAAAMMGYNIPVGLAVSRGVLPFETANTLKVLGEGANRKAAILLLKLGKGASSPFEPEFEFSDSDATFLSAINTEVSKSTFTKNEALPAKFSVCTVISEYEDEGFKSTPYRIEMQQGTGSEPYSIVDGAVAPTRYETYPFCLVTDTDGSLYIAVCGAQGTSAGNGALYGAGFVAARDANGKINCSSSDMILVGGDAEYANQWLPGGQLYNETLDALGVGAASIV